MTDITIPPEVVEAVFKKLAPAAINHSEAHAAILAALNAWPGMGWQQVTGPKDTLVSSIILPLTEKPDAEG